MVKKNRRFSIATATTTQPAAGFFQLCGSPIRTDVQSQFTYDYDNVQENVHRGAPATPTTPPLSGATRRPLTQVSMTRSISGRQPVFAEESKENDATGAANNNPPLEKKKSAPLSLAQARDAGIVMSNWTDSRLPPMLMNSPHAALHTTISMTELELGAVLGEGAFGKVYAAKWYGKRVAVKMLIRQNLSEDVVREFETEVKIMSFLNHPNICRLLGACLEPNHRALVIELFERGCLWNLLRTHRRQLRPETRIQMVVDVARGMQYLHSFERPILHRDMKSPNLLVAPDFSIKISDFGLARVKAQIQTMTGNCGTVQWMAPEVLSNHKYTEKADVYSFAIVMWEIFTGCCPYGKMPQIAVAISVINSNMRPTIPTYIPKFFSRLIKVCWSRDPEKRPSFKRVLRLYNHYAHQESLRTIQ